MDNVCFAGPGVTGSLQGAKAANGCFTRGRGSGKVEVGLV